MAKLNGFPYSELEFTRDGDMFRDEQVKALLAMLTPDVASDLVVLTHGWNNDRAEAAALYEGLTARLREQLVANPGSSASRKFVILEVFWPSKKFADPELIPGGGAAALNEGPTIQSLEQQIEVMTSLLDRPDERRTLTVAKHLIQTIENTPADQKRFAVL